MAGKLTKARIDSITASTKDVFLWDEQVPGYCLKVTPTGRKIFLLVYRIGGRGSPVKRFKVGDYGTLTPDQARKEAIRLKGQIASGLDPAEAKLKQKSAILFGEFSKRYLAEYAELHKK
ncbi:MAG: DUF4102 domain-containing protein, partial [Nitrospira sp.]|nr:DUF4102 domain-containing protein [Nitrospira sp.]